MTDQVQRHDFKASLFQECSVLFRLDPQLERLFEGKHRASKQHLTRLRLGRTARVHHFHQVFDLICSDQCVTGVEIVYESLTW